MTIKNAGAPLSMSEINTEVRAAANSQRKLGFTTCRKLAGAPQTTGVGVWAPPGVYSFTVPQNVNELIFDTIIGAGGGGGGYAGGGGNSDTHSGGGGGGGAIIRNAKLTVTPGDTITVTIGQGGTSASVQYYNGVWVWQGTSGLTGAYATGGNGADTTIDKNGTRVFRAGGGIGGTYGGPGDNCGGVSGAGGTTFLIGGAASFPGVTTANGNSGGTINCNRNNFTATPGGAGMTRTRASTVFGAGGASWAAGGGGSSAPQVGGDGFVSMIYTIAGVPVSGQISMSQFYGKTATY